MQVSDVSFPVQRNFSSTHAIDALMDSAKVDPEAFNVLNHGDMWCNNMMFIYDSENKLQDALLVDYQISNYGSPIMDLCYFLFSSTQFEIKLSEFEYFFQYYHENLTECLTKLGYTKRMPKLNELFMDFYKRGFFGRSCPVVSILLNVVTYILSDCSFRSNIRAIGHRSAR
jgi:aminoglycoside phosphotransferase (APT) family kinase protein